MNNKSSADPGLTPSRVETNPPGNNPDIAPCAWTALFIVVLWATNTAVAAVVPSCLFSDHAVLQANREVPVWGWDNPGQNVTVTLGPVSASGIANANGRWEVKLPAMKASEMPQELKMAGSTTVIVKDVLVGQVWVGSGQSNMAWTLNADYSHMDTATVMKARSEWNHPELRMFTVEENMSSPEHVRDVAGKWTVCTPNTAGTWSAAGYYFGLAIQKDLGGEAVGIITTAVGGTQISMWIETMAYLEAHPEIAAKTLAAIKEGAPKVEDYYAGAARQNPRPARPVPVWPGGFFATMVAPLMPYAITGIAWYQGESDSYRKQPGDYAKSLAMLMRTWRAGWKQGDVPFVIFQLANVTAKGYVGPDAKPVQEDPVEYEAQFPPIREVQRLTAAADPNACLVVVIDSPDPNGVHPKNKAPFGRRWALQAMKLAYGKKDLVASGPLFAGCEFRDGKAMVKFTETGGGLAIKEGETLQGFAMAGSDGKFVWAKARIEGNSVILSADGINEPAAIRYAWAENPIGNLINKEGLPASPFQTDSALADKK